MTCENTILSINLENQINSINLFSKEKYFIVKINPCNHQLFALTNQGIISLANDQEILYPYTDISEFIHLFNNNMSPSENKLFILLKTSRIIVTNSMQIIKEFDFSFESIPLFLFI